MSIALALLTTMLLAASPAAADETDNRDRHNFKKVDTYFSVTWRRGKGACSNGYKLISASYRFHRDVRARYVQADIRMGQKFVHSCAGDPQNKQIEEEHKACFGCNGNARNWSRSYYFAPNWPYVAAPEAGSPFGFQHARLKVTVRAPGDSSTVTLGRFCRASIRVGGNPC